MPTTLDSIGLISLIGPILKWAILLILLFYAIFAAVIVRQVDLMSKALITSISPYIRAFAFFHAIFAIGLIVLAFVIL